MQYSDVEKCLTSKNACVFWFAPRVSAYSAFALRSCPYARSRARCALSPRPTVLPYRGNRKLCLQERGRGRCALCRSAVALDSNLTKRAPRPDLLVKLLRKCPGCAACGSRRFRRLVCLISHKHVLTVYLDLFCWIRIVWPEFCTALDLITHAGHEAKARLQVKHCHWGFNSSSRL